MHLLLHSIHVPWPLGPNYTQLRAKLTAQASFRKRRFAMLFRTCSGHGKPCRPWSRRHCGAAGPQCWCRCHPVMRKWSIRNKTLVDGKKMHKSTAGSMDRCTFFSLFSFILFPFLPSLFFSFTSSFPAALSPFFRVANRLIHQSPCHSCSSSCCDEAIHCAPIALSSSSPGAINKPVAVAINHLPLTECCSLVLPGTCPVGTADCYGCVHCKSRTCPGRRCGHGRAWRS